MLQQTYNVDVVTRSRQESCFAVICNALVKEQFRVHVREIFEAVAVLLWHDGLPHDFCFLHRNVSRDTRMICR